MTLNLYPGPGRYARLLIIALLATCILLPIPAAAEQLQQSAACLPDDPYDLDTMIQVMSRPNPPTVPVQLNDDLTLVYVGVGDMIADGEDDTEPGPTPRPCPA